MNKSHYYLNLSLILHNHSDVNGKEEDFFLEAFVLIAYCNCLE